MVQHQVVAVGVGEEGHLAAAGVQRIARERDAPALQLGAGAVEVVDVQGDVAVFLRREGPADAFGLPDRQAGLAGPELVLRMIVGS